MDKKGRTWETAYKTAYSGDELNTLANSTGEIPGQQEVKGIDTSSESDRGRVANWISSGIDRKESKF